jgi:hypothetical protein
MALVGWRRRPKVEYDVMDGTAGAPQKLVFLRRGDLIMEAAKRMLMTIVGDVRLDNPVGQALLVELLLTPTSCKKAAVIFSFLQAHDVNGRDLRRCEFH